MNNKKNLVDERLECISAIFRLTGEYWEYSEIRNDYQKEVAKTFAGFANHKAVEYVKNLGWSGYSEVPQFSVHIEKKDNKFILIEDISFPINSWGEAEVKIFYHCLTIFMLIQIMRSFIIHIYRILKK